MRHVVLATAAAVLLSGTASAREPGMDIAMGPTSAAHFPTNQPRDNSSPDCTLPDAQCRQPTKPQGICIRPISLRATRISTINKSLQ
jgi:hypothetical protein